MTHYKAIPRTAFHKRAVKKEPVAGLFRLTLAVVPKHAGHGTIIKYVFTFFLVWQRSQDISPFPHYLSVINTYNICFRPTASKITHKALCTKMWKCRQSQIFPSGWINLTYMVFMLFWQTKVVARLLLDNWKVEKYDDSSNNLQAKIYNERMDRDSYYAM